MDDARYELLYRGEILDGFDPAAVKQEFARLFRLSGEKLEQAFHHRKVILRRDLSADDADRHLDRLEAIGLKVHLRQAEKAQAPTTPPAAAAPPTDKGIADRDGTRDTADEGPRSLPFTFHGSGGEYFKIWIVNVLLSIVTLGIYSAWAKVRNEQYFYGNTRLDGSTFQYLANPLAILKGRLIAVALLAVYIAARNLLPPLAAALFLLFLFVFPILVTRALAFRARNSAYRNVPFGFEGRYGDAYVAYLLWPIVGIISLGLLMPYAIQRQQAFIVGNGRYGTREFAFNTTVGAYYRLFLLMLGLMLLTFILTLAFTLILPPLGQVVAVICYLGAIAFYTVELTNLRYNGAVMGEHRLQCNFTVGSFAWLFFSNSLLTLLTLGLFYPWAKVRNARYKAERMQFVAAGEIEAIAAKEQKQVGAFGQEMDNLFDMDVAF